jgi:glycosyltransferase involved in cell wall biosynthesis
MKVLFLSRWFPFPADNGARLRIFHLLKALSIEHEVSLVSFTSQPVAETQAQAMRAWCARVQTALYKPFQPHSLKSRLGVLAWQPRSVVSTDSAEMHALVRAEAGRLKPDLVIASQVDMIPYARNLAARRMIEELEVGIIHQGVESSQGARKMRAWMTWLKLKAYLRSVAQDFQGCTIVSENERQLVWQITDTMPLAVVPNGVDVEGSNQVRATPAPDTLIYNGSLTYGPNLDAVQFFVREIFPLVLRERPAARLFVTGATEGVPAEQLPRHDNLVLTGYVDDIKSCVAGSWLAIAPIRRGGGTRLKVLEAMALRTPVVSTSKGAEGLGLVDGRDALIADAPEPFARHVVKVLTSADARYALADAGARTVAERFDWRAIGRSLSQFAATVAGH